MTRCEICKQFVPEEATLELRYSPIETRVACKSHPGVTAAARGEVEQLLDDADLVNPFALTERQVALLTEVLGDRATWELKPAKVVRRLLDASGNGNRSKGSNEVSGSSKDTTRS